MERAITIDETTPGLQPWERVDWAELNAAETGSHHLTSSWRTAIL